MLSERGSGIGVCFSKLNKNAYFIFSYALYNQHVISVHANIDRVDNTQIWLFAIDSIAKDYGLYSGKHGRRRSESQ